MRAPDSRIELAFLPLLGALIAPPILRERARTRASLGHTGRPLVVARPVAWASGLLTAAAFARAVMPHAGALAYDRVLAAAALLWSGALVILVGVFWPVLVRPRLDGKPR